MFESKVMVLGIISFCTICLRVTLTSALMTLVMDLKKEMIYKLCRKSSYFRF